MLFVLSVFVIALSLVLILKNISYTKFQNGVEFNAVPTFSVENQSQTSGDNSQISEIKFPIDLNLVTKEELMGITGIGEKTALKIINYRTEKGGFTSINDLLNIGGIAEKTLEKLKKYLYVKDDIIVKITTNPSPCEAPKTNVTTGTSKSTISEVKYPLDINFATLDELITLKNIGETRANAIINYRKNTGYFYTIEDIMNVDGIGEAIFLGIKEKIFINTKLIPPKSEVTTTATTTTPPTNTTVHPETTATTSQQGLINLNTATLEELVSVEGITEQIAQKIIEHRSQPNVSFARVEELNMFMSKDLFNKVKDKFIQEYK